MSTASRLLWVLWCTINCMYTKQPEKLNTWNAGGIEELLETSQDRGTPSSGVSRLDNSTKQQTSWPSQGQLAPLKIPYKSPPHPTLVHMNLSCICII